MRLFDIDSSNPIVQWRQETGQSRSDLAKRSGVSAETIRRWETGAVLPLDENIADLAKHMGRKPKALYDELAAWQAEHGTPLRRTASS